MNNHDEPTQKFLPLKEIKIDLATSLHKAGKQQLKKKAKQLTSGGIYPNKKKGTIQDPPRDVGRDQELCLDH